MATIVYVNTTTDLGPSKLDPCGKSVAKAFSVGTHASFTDFLFAYRKAGRCTEKREMNHAYA